MILYLFAILPPFLVAYATTGWLLRGEVATLQRRLLQIGLSCLLSLGVSAAFFWGWLTVFGAPTTAYFITEVGINLLLAASLAIYSWRTGLPAATTITAASKPSLLLAGCTAILAVVVGLTVYNFCAANPDGGWDAWDNWNSKARYIYRDPANWEKVTSDHFELPDYPPLLPMANARIWTWQGSDQRWVSCLTSIIFTVGIATTLTGAVGIVRSANQGLLALLLFLGWDNLSFWSSSQYADLPLAGCMLAAVICLLFSWRETPHREIEFGWIFLSGTFASLSACLKNEGLVFVAVYFITSGVILLQQAGLRTAASKISIALLGAAAGLSVLAWFKLSLAPSTHLLAEQDLSTLQKLSDWSRHQIVVAGIWQQIISHAFLLLLVMPLAFIFWGKSKSQTLAVRWVLAVLLLMSGFYYAAYIVTPYDLRWHVINSVDRLALQLWPLALLAFALAVKSPAEVMAEAPATRSVQSPVILQTT
ncbi:hypothetical protein [Anatilimnocola floriformis]|uniref:hypothetical protein n=1 Tax=Anatilimnocola floriformis TaxID=2948575 RepID=UPI0020C4F5DF|nr:hypothetical protein [Anatilimnocola floriformis]